LLYVDRTVTYSCGIGPQLRGGQIGTDTMNTDPERVAVLRAARNSLTAELLTLKNEVREKVARLEVLQRRLAELEQAEHELTGE
jgi:hypothetical protein